jgi:hypothetical protein
MGKKYTGRKSIRKKARSFKKTINRNKQKNGKTRRKTRRPKKLERQIKKKSRRIRRKVRRAKKKSRKASGKGGAPIDDDGDDDAYYELEEGKAIDDLKQLIKDTYTFDGDNNITGYKISEHLEPDEIIYQLQPQIGRNALKDLYERRSIKLPPGWHCRKDSDGTWQYIGSHQTPRGQALVHAVHPVLPEPWKFELDNDGNVVNIVNEEEGTILQDWEHPLELDEEMLPPGEAGALPVNLKDWLKFGKWMEAEDLIFDELYAARTHAQAEDPSSEPEEEEPEEEERRVDPDDGGEYTWDEFLLTYGDGPVSEDGSAARMWRDARRVDNAEGRIDVDLTGADENNREVGDFEYAEEPREYECDYCNMTGNWDDVVAHEEVCPRNPDR